MNFVDYFINPESISVVFVCTYISTLIMLSNTMRIAAKHRLSSVFIDQFFDGLSFPIGFAYKLNSRGNPQGMIKEASLRGRSPEAKILMIFSYAVLAFYLLTRFIGIISGIANQNLATVTSNLLLLLYIVVSNLFALKKSASISAVRV